MLNFPTHCAMCGGKWFINHECPPRHNAGMPQTNAEKQKAFKQAMAEAGYVRLEAWVTREQREKFRQIGSDEWLRRKIDAAKVKDAPER